MESVQNALTLSAVPINLPALERLMVVIPSLAAAIPLLVICLCRRTLRTDLLSHPYFYDWLMACACGVAALIPLLRLTSGNGHYAGAIIWFVSPATAVALAMFWQNWQKHARALSRLAAVTISSLFVLCYLGGLVWGDVVMISERRLQNDLIQRSEIRAALDARLPPNESVLCLSVSATPKLYYMSGRRPFTPYLYFNFNVEHKFNYQNAVELLQSGKVRAAVLEVRVPNDQASGEISADQLARLNATYESVDLPHGDDHSRHSRIFVLIRRD
jgi:hypothetical protein